MMSLDTADFMMALGWFIGIDISGLCSTVKYQTEWKLTT